MNKFLRYLIGFLKMGLWPAYPGIGMRSIGGTSSILLGCLKYYYLLA